MEKDVGALLNVALHATLPGYSSGVLQRNLFGQPPLFASDERHKRGETAFQTILNTVHSQNHRDGNFSAATIDLKSQPNEISDALYYLDLELAQMERTMFDMIKASGFVWVFRNCVTLIATFQLGLAPWKVATSVPMSFALLLVGVIFCTLYPLTGSHSYLMLRDGYRKSGDTTPLPQHRSVTCTFLSYIRK